jgi:hypothetical protein
VGRRRAVGGLALVAVGAVLSAVAVIAVILGITVTVTSIGAARAVTVATAVPIVVAIAVAALLLARGVVTSAAAGRRRTATTGRARSTALAVPARLEPPRSRGRGASPLNLQEVVAAHALVMHLMVGIVGVTPVLVLYKGKQSARGGAGSRNVAADETAIAKTKACQQLSTDRTEAAV